MTSTTSPTHPVYGKCSGKFRGLRALFGVKSDSKNFRDARCREIRCDPAHEWRKSLLPPSSFVKIAFHTRRVDVSRVDEGKKSRGPESTALYS
jgi:hypothetical protein